MSAVGSPAAAHGGGANDAPSDLVCLDPAGEDVCATDAGSVWPAGTFTRDLGDSLPVWSPFRRVKLTYPDGETRRKALTQRGAPWPEVVNLPPVAAAGFVNSTYCVLVWDGATAHGMPCWRVIIQRRDGQRPGAERYPDFMRIRDELFGEDREAIEIYPARSTAFDMSHSYHLWILLSPDDEFPIGGQGARLKGDEANAAVQAALDAVVARHAIVSRSGAPTSAQA